MNKSIDDLVDRLRKETAALRVAANNVVGENEALRERVAELEQQLAARVPDGLTKAAQQARDWIAERQEDRPISAGKMVSILTRALEAAPQPVAQPEQPAVQQWSDADQSALNDWFLSLDQNRQKVLIEDKWMLAGAAFAAGKAAQPEPPAVGSITELG